MYKMPLGKSSNGQKGHVEHFIQAGYPRMRYQLLEML